jgi:hypothetical protein
MSSVVVGVAQLSCSRSAKASRRDRVRVSSNALCSSTSKLLCSGSTQISSGSLVFALTLTLTFTPTLTLAPPGASAWSPFNRNDMAGV